VTIQIKIKEQPNADGTIGHKTPSGIIINGSIAGTSFQVVKPQIKKRLVVAVEGPEKSGKTHFALTAPGPIGFQDIDIGTEGVVEQFVAEKEIHLAEYALDFPFEQKAAELTWKQFTNDYKQLLGASVRTGIIDNASEAWDLLRVAKFGRLTQIMPHLYTTANSEFRGLLRLAYKSDMNLILLHKVKKQYINEQFTGKYERSGFNDIGYLVQVIVETYKDGGKYFLRVLACRQNPKIEGLVIEDPTFAKLGMAVFPGTGIEDWQ
jgi:hypothetical protein